MKIRIKNIGDFEPIANIGDVVKVTSIGHCYSAYKQAFYQMQGEHLYFDNCKNTENCFTLSFSNTYFPFLMDVDLEHIKWRVIDICLHENGLSLIYLIGAIINFKQVGLMISGDGIELIQKRYENIKKIYYKVCGNLF